MVEGSLASPFPPLCLSDDEKQAILNKVDELLNDSLSEYEKFLHQDRATVSELLWKPVVKRDGMTAYRKRRVSPRASDSTKVYTVLVVGEIEGTVGDVMLGSVHDSSDFTSAYEDYIYRSSTLGSALLCSIIAPTSEAPDRTVRIAWDMLGSMSTTLDTMVKPRDYVVAAATGTTINSSGERIGYLFYHSVDVASAPPLPRAIRATRHLIFLYRQISPDRMHVYIIGRSDPKGRVPAGVAARLTSEAIIDTVIRINSFAAIKKRTFLLNRRLQQNDPMGDFFVGVPADFAVAVSAGECAVCGKRASGLLSSGRPCVVCGNLTCSSCIKPRQVIMASEKNKKTRASIKKLLFCLSCEGLATELNGSDLNNAEVAATHAKAWYDVNPSFSSTASWST